MKLNFSLIEETSNKRQKGFTLIELVVSTGIMVLVLTTAFTFYSSSLKSYKNSISLFYTQQNARQSLIRLSSSIRQAKEVKIISKEKIQIITPDGENIYYYIKRGMLYREKNGGINPVAELQMLEFIKPVGTDYIELHIFTNQNGKTMDIKTKVTPFGVLAR